MADTASNVILAGTAQLETILGGTFLVGTAQRAMKPILDAAPITERWNNRGACDPRRALKYPKSHPCRKRTVEDEC